MTRVAVTGLPFFGRRVAPALRRDGFAARFVPGAREALTRPGALLHLLRAQVVYAIGPSIERWGPLDLVARLPGKRIIVHWVGTDVEYGVRAVQAGTASRRLMERATHLADAPWLVEELAGAGIAATEQALPMPIATGQAAPMPAEHRVLVYLPEQPGPAHDVEGTLAVIAALPDLAFTVVGGYVPGRQLPNLRSEGFVTDMASQYRAHSILLRLTNHDGLSHSVIEALSFGRHVAWTHALPGVREVHHPAEAEAVLRELTATAPTLNDAGLRTAERYRTEATVGAARRLLSGTRQ